MKTHGKRLLSCLLALLLLATSVPLGGLPNLAIQANAANLDGYNAIAAAEWAKEQVGSYSSILFGTRYWYDGGDCANFVSEAIYMGGLDPDSSWNHQGWNAHFSLPSDGSWIRAQQLYDYVVSIGGKSIRNPSASQIEVGDLIFFKESPNSRMHHSSIVVEADGKNVSIAAHSTNRTAYIDSNWHLGFANNCTYLVKMNGATCTDQVIRSFDVYKAKGRPDLFKEAGGRVSVTTFHSGEYAHIYRTKKVNGANWGYTFRYGNWGWVKLSQFTYQRHVETGPIDHIMGDWKVVVQPTCSDEGVEERTCSRCGYKETRKMGVGGAHKNIVAATCLSPSYCTACGEILSPALGHDWDEWNILKAPTCLNDGTEKRDCFRCGKRETRTAEALGHNYEAVVTLPGCTTSGTTTYQCSRCKDSYIENATWSGYSAIDTSDPKYAEFLNNPELSRSRTEYRYRTKSTAIRSNTTGKAPALSGWTLFDTTSKWNNYGSWSSWSTKKVTGSDYRQVETKQEHTGYNLLTNCYHRIGDTYGRYYTNFYLGGEDAEGDQNRLDHGYTAEYWQPERYRTVTIAQLNAATKVAAGADSPDSPNNYRGKNDTNVTGYWMPSSETSSNYRIWFIDSNAYTTYYRYRDRTKTYTYSYYKWSDWSGWSPTKQTASSTKEVQTRTTYSFKQSVLGHNWDEGVVVKPTCLTGGYTLYTCKRCGVTMKTAETAPLGHDLRNDWYLLDDDGTTKTYRRDCHRDCGYYEIKSESCIYKAAETVAPTCTEDGYTLYRCQTHPNETYKSDIVPALGHECSEQWVVTKAPTCTEKGEEQCFCVRHDDGTTCDKVYTREIEAVGHNLVKTEAVAMTCEKDGCKEYYTCKNCNVVFADAEAATQTTLEQLRIPASGHSRVNADGEEVWIVEQEAACGVTGRERLYCQNEHCDETYTCESCGDTHHALLDEREIAEITPNYALVYHEEPTCYAGGYDEYSCLNCIGTDHEHGYTEILGLADHTWGEWELDVEPLCIYEGAEKRTCAVCGEMEYRELPAPYDSHDFETITLNPSCTSGGESYQKCKRCGYEEGKEEIGAMGHDMVLDTENSWAPTCEEPGVNHYVCTRGDYEYDEYIDPIGHDYQLTDHTDATCLQPGMNVYTCTRDASHTYEEIDENEPALGHEMGEWYTIREANYAQTRIDQCDCIRGDYSQTRELPKLERPIEENDAVETDKTVDYNAETGEATITLKTWSEAEKLVQQETFAMPLDIVLVVDQSGSMEGARLRSLKSAAKEFIQTVYEDAKTKNVDHRIAVAGFSVGNYTQDSRNYPKFLNTELFTGKNGIVSYRDLEAGDGNYESALVSVNENGKMNARLARVTEQFDAKGATAANFGLAMANNVFGANPVEDGARQRIVVFMTDGAPTPWSSDFDSNVATETIEEAYELKNVYDAVVYSIGFMTDNSSEVKRFLNAVSSNYPNAESVNRLGKMEKDAYYKTADAIDDLSEIFRSIAVETTEYYTKFKNLTLIDTVSAYFTLTTAQETKLREDAMQQLGVRNEDITVTRHQNGTTTIQISGIQPKQVTENGKVIYRTEFSFTVSADGDALKADTYHTNEDDSGVSLDGETFVSKFSSPTVTMDEERGAAIFCVNGEPYQIVSIEIGGVVEAPVYALDNSLRWNVPEGYTLSGGTVTFNAEQGEHQHTYQEIVLKEANCGTDGLAEYLCDCGANYIQTIPATGAHEWHAIRGNAGEGAFAMKEFRCEVCGEMRNEQLLYQMKETETATGRNAETTVSVTEEIRFGHLDEDGEQPNGEVEISAAISNYFNQENLRDVYVYREESNGNRTRLPSSYQDGVVTFTTDHFCPFIFEAVYVCQQTGAHHDENLDGFCDDCGELVSEWYAFRCKMCRTYEEHKDEELIGFFYTLVHFFVHLAHFIGYLT